MFLSQNIPPMFNYGHVYFYLLESVEKESNEDVTSIMRRTGVVVAGNTVTPKPFKEGTYLVGNIQDNSSPTWIMFYVHIFTTPCLASGNVNNCTCSCKASVSGRCAHVLALFLHLDEYVKTKSSSKSKPCEWDREQTTKEP